MPEESEEILRDDQPIEETEPSQQTEEETFLGRASQSPDQIPAAPELRKLRKTEQNQQALLEYLRAGKLLKDACALVGIHKETYYNWVRKYPEFADAIQKIERQPKQPKPRPSGKVKVDTDTILDEIQQFREKNPTKKDKEIHTMFLESKRDWIIAKLFDTAENGDTPTIRFNAQARLKDELDGRVATQEKRDADEDSIISSISLPEDM